MGKQILMKYRVVLEVNITQGWADVEDFTKAEIDAFNEANKDVIEVLVKDITET